MDEDYSSLIKEVPLYDIIEKNSLFVVQLYLNEHCKIIRNYVGDFTDSEFFDNDYFSNYYGENNNKQMLIEHLKTYTCCEAAKWGRFDIMNWADENNFNMNNPEIIFNAAANLDYDMVKWCIEHQCPYNYVKCMQQVNSHPEKNNNNIGDNIDNLLKNNL
jgi:hypothetical protein